MPPRANRFLEALIRFLLPHFLPAIPDQAAAREEIIQTLADYGARTRAEMISAAQIIAFSFTALDVLAESQVNEMSTSMRLRYRGCANNLNRSTRQTEAALAKRQASAPPEPVEPTPELIDDLPEAEVQQALHQARANIDAYRARLLAATGPKSPEDLNMAAWTNAIVDVLGPIGTAAHSPAPPLDPLAAITAPSHR